MKDTYAKLIHIARNTEDVDYFHKQEFAGTALNKQLELIGKRSLEGELLYLDNVELNDLAFYFAECIKISVLIRIGNARILNLLLRRRDTHLWKYRRDDEDIEDAIDSVISGWIIDRLDLYLSLAIDIAHMCDDNILYLRKEVLTLFDGIKFIDCP